MDPITAFSVARLPEIQFGSGTVTQIAPMLARYGKRALLVTGRRSFVATEHWQRLQHSLETAGVERHWVRVAEEPSPELVDNVVAEYRPQSIEVVVGIGGGSVLDAAKAIAGLLPSGHSVMDYLEGVGRGLPYRGPALPWVAVPTTAGTGSEATKNAVLSRRGPGGFKKSFRHQDLVARVAIVDPDLLRSCRQNLLAANGMDAFTQLLESYLSPRASAFTDALAWSGLEAFGEGFWPVWQAPAEAAPSAYGRLAYASLLSGITLAQAGLGSVHGLASPLGAYYPLAHGVICGSLVAEACAVNIRALQERDADGLALIRYARVAQLLTGQRYADQAEALTALVALLRDWVARLGLPRLREYGVVEEDFGHIISHCRGGSMQTNPLLLSDQELAEVLRARL
jgi:alcohol dehydrogenase class IV